MYRLIFLSILACAAGAPQGRQEANTQHGDSTHHIADLPELTSFTEQALKHLSAFNRSPTTTSFKDNQYILSVKLSKVYEEKMIAVTAGRGKVLLAIGIIEKPEDTYKGNVGLELFNLPECVNPAGTWTLEDGAVKMVCNLIEGCTTSTEAPKETETGVNAYVRIG